MRLALVFLLSSSLAFAAPSRCFKIWGGIAAAAGMVIGGIGYAVYDRQSREVNHAPEFGEENGLCCVCRYQTVADCARLSEKKCEETRTGRNGTIDCRWQEGKCLSRFETYCAQWFGAPEQKGCLVGVTQAEGSAYDLRKSFEGKSCQKVRYRYTGHGRHDTGLRRAVESVLAEAPAGINAFQFDDDGCSTFSNLESASTQMRGLVESQRQRLVGKSVQISAFQCKSNIEPDTRGRYLFEIDGTRAPAALSGEAASCGSSCLRLQSGQTVRCLDKGSLVSRTCRCSTSWRGESCRWE